MSDKTKTQKQAIYAIPGLFGGLLIAGMIFAISGTLGQAFALLVEFATGARPLIPPLANLPPQQMVDALIVAVGNLAALGIAAFFAYYLGSATIDAAHYMYARARARTRK